MKPTNIWVMRAAHGPSYLGESQHQTCSKGGRAICRLVTSVQPALSGCVRECHSLPFRFDNAEFRLLGLDPGSESAELQGKCRELGEGPEGWRRTRNPSFFSHVRQNRERPWPCLHPLFLSTIVICRVERTRGILRDYWVIDGMTTLIFTLDNYLRSLSMVSLSERLLAC